MQKSSGRQRQIDFFRWVLVTGVTDSRSNNARTDHHVASFVNSAVRKRYGVGRVVWPVITGVWATRGTRHPIHLGFDIIERGYEFREDTRCFLSGQLGFR